ncbi:hypothetical protein GEV33_008669 [Tenebrio molitor]|uniref:Uncharacterized protein n=1 Tax=Tenebrio molitor TaxID=7067 RepID=A0A8J6H8N9_TENMO|nr:hypothetical protein GEV33_008669 [Tenebrio molitor]
MATYLPALSLGKVFILGGVPAKRGFWNELSPPSFYGTDPKPQRHDAEPNQKCGADRDRTNGTDRTGGTGCLGIPRTYQNSSMGPKRDQTNFANGSHRTKIDQNMPKHAKTGPKQANGFSSTKTGPCYQNRTEVFNGTMLPKHDQTPLSG